jgi:phosphoglucosamine mutase
MTKKSKLFGTDGIRQQVGQLPLDGRSIAKLCQAVGTVTQGSKITIGRDTRESGQHIEELIAAGISTVSDQCHIIHAGVIPTPGLSFITQHKDFDCGIMITASHNPYTDNGIKIFANAGEKIPEEMETRIEDIFFRLQDSWSTVPPKPRLNDTSPVNTGIYLHFLSTHAASGIKETPLKIVIDCAHCTTYEMALLIFREAGLDQLVIHAEPDGKNINRECVATHLKISDWHLFPILWKITVRNSRRI